jgi:hypothetical protein
MAIDPNLAPGGLPPQIAMQQTAQALGAARAVAAASLTNALVLSAGRPHSVSEVHAIWQDFYMLLFPDPQNGRYQAWAKEKDARFATVHK